MGSGDWNYRPRDWTTGTLNIEPLSRPFYQYCHPVYHCTIYCLNGFHFVCPFIHQGAFGSFKFHLLILLLFLTVLLWTWLPKFLPEQRSYIPRLHKYLGYIPRHGTTGSRDNSMLNFWRTTKWTHFHVYDLQSILITSYERQLNPKPGFKGFFSEMLVRAARLNTSQNCSKARFHLGLWTASLLYLLHVPTRTGRAGIPSCLLGILAFPLCCEHLRRMKMVNLTDGFPFSVFAKDFILEARGFALPVCPWLEATFFFLALEPGCP